MADIVLDRNSENDLVWDENSGEYVSPTIPSNPIVKELEANDTVYDIIGKGIVNNNSSTPLKMWSGTKDEYDALETKNNDTIYHITDDEANNFQDMLEMIYPIGSIYIGTMNICPLSALFGTWEKVSSGRVLQGADENHNPGTTIEAGLPNITGSVINVMAEGSQSASSFTGAFSSSSIKNYSYHGYSQYTDTNYNISLDASLSNSIYGNSDTVQPPAFVVNIWKRTA